MSQTVGETKDSLPHIDDAITACRDAADYLRGQDFDDGVPSDERAQFRLDALADHLPALYAAQLSPSPVREGLLDATGWQLMETAPKDGVWILAHIGTLGAQVIRYVQACDDDGDQWVGWCYAGNDTEISPLYPTHWMSLPKPPQETAS